MRRNDEEFKAEIMRRCSEYEKKRAKRRRVTLMSCIPLVLCIGITVGFLWQKSPPLDEVSEISEMSAEKSEKSGQDAADAVDENVLDSLPGNPSEEPGLTTYSESDTNGSSSNEDCKVETVKIEIKTEAENTELDRLYTDPQKIAEIKEIISSAAGESETQDPDRGTVYIITLTDARGNACSYTCSSETRLAQVLKDKLLSLPSD